MNAWQAWKLWRVAKQKTQEVMRMETRVGWKTTEFWITAIVSVLDVLGMAAGMLPPEHGSVILAIVNASYNVARGISKHGVPNYEKTGNSPPTGW